MAIAPTTYTPLGKWTRALTIQERAGERQHETDSRLANLDLADLMRIPPTPRRGVREDCFPSHPGVVSWMPVLPTDIVDCCPWCVLPSREARLCRGCRILQRAFAPAISTLEFISCADVATPPESYIYTWKMGTGMHDDPLVGASYEFCAERIGAPLSAYLEAHAARLLAGGPLITAVPSRAPLIATTMALARRHGWFACDVPVSGTKRGEWAQHTAQDQAERRSRTERDWVVDPTGVRGRDIVLLDDVFVTGTSLFSYAAALKRAGAKTIRAIAIARHVSLGYPHYRDALIIARRTHDLTWTPQRAHVAEVTALR